MSEFKNTKVRKIQEATMGIYKEIKSICDENDIRFFAIGGTAIGTVRHSGFIPWDDDIDIAIPRDDYERFRDIATRLLPSHLELSDFSDDDFGSGMLCKVSDIRTTAMSRGDVSQRIYQGLSVDIMPLDGAPNSSLGHRWYMKKISWLIAMKKAIYMSRSGIGIRRLHLRLVSAAVVRLFGHDWVVGRYLRLVKKYPFDSSRYLARTWLAGTHDGMQHLIRYSKEDFSSYIEMPFEDTSMRMPSGYDSYLSALYPNYMTIPPVEKQLPSHSDGIVDFNHSYRYYRAKQDGKVIGFTSGCFDMFHVGHLNILKQAKRHCDYLVVSVNSDEAMFSRKNKYPIVPEEERVEVLRALSYVDEAYVNNQVADKFQRAHEELGYDVVFVGDDHKGSKEWDALEAYLSNYSAKVHYFAYTKETSSTMLRRSLDEIIDRKARRESDLVGIGSDDKEPAVT